MKRLLIIWAIFTGLCLAYLYPYRKEIGLYWREWSSFQRHFVCNNKDEFGLRRPFLSETVAQQDPEAAAIVELICRDYRGDSHRSESKDIDDLSNLSLKYPDNPYFLYDLACRLTSRTYIDPQIINSIADRLLRLDPNNGRYYSLKAWTAFYDWDDNRAEKALEYLEKCFSSPNTQDPYELYKARVCGLMEKEKPTSLISNWPATWHTNDYLLSRNVVKDLLVYTQDLIVNSRSDRALQIHDRLQQIAENNVPRKIEMPWRHFWLSFRVNYMMHIETPQTVELKWMDLTPQRARQNRLQMLAWEQWDKQISFHKDTPRTQSTPQLSHSVKEKTPPAAHGFQMTIASVVVLFAFIGVGLILKMRQSRLSWFTFVAMIVVSLGYFLVYRWGDYQQMHNDMCGDHHYTFDCVPCPFFMVAILCLCKPFAGYAAAGVSLSLGVIAAILHKKYIRPNLFCRVIIKILCVLLAGSLWIWITRLQFAALAVDIVFLSIVIPLLCFRRENKYAGGYHGLFSLTEEGRRYRGCCVMLSGYAVILHLVVFTIFSSSLAVFTSCAVQEQKGEIAWQPVYPPRYTIDPNSYQNLLAQFETQGPSKIYLSEWLPMVEPTDIPKVLTILKERREKDPNSRLGPGMGAPVPPGEAGFMGYNRDYQSDLLGAMNFCGRDALPYIIPFLKDPDRIIMLIIRGRAGDTSVRQRLVDEWKKNRDAGFPVEQEMRYGIANTNAGPAEEPVPLGALVGICPYLEIRDYILEYSKWVIHHKDHFIPDRELMTYFTRQQKGDLINRWIPVVKETRLNPYSVLELLQYNAELNTVSQEWLWKRMIDCGNNQDKRYSLDDLNLENKPSDYHISDGLLAGCLNNQNERLRAMGQHIYRKLGKPLDEQILQRWAGDSNFVVRADVALLRPGKIPASDPSAFVRLIRNLAEQKRNQPER